MIRTLATLRALGCAVVVCLAAGVEAAARAPVADAAMAGNTTLVRDLLRDGADVNTPQGDGMTALHWAALNGDEGLTSMLLYAGANPRATTRLGGHTPLHLASHRGQAAVARLLVKAGADPGAPTSTGATPLMLGAASGRAEMVATLLDAGADPNVTESAHGETALMFAAALDRADVVRLLLRRGARPAITAKVVDLTEATAPEEALQNELRQAAQTRGAPRPPADGASTSRTPEVAGVTRPYRYNELIGKQGGLTALHFAARQGAADTVRALVEAGASVNQVSPADQVSPVLIAAINGQFDISKYLLDHGADPTLASDDGVTPLYAVLNVHWAPRMFYPQPRAHLQQQTSYLDLMAALLDRGADPNARVRRKVWFTQYNFDLLRVDDSGATPFWRAAYASDIEAMKLLVARGADPHIPTTRPARRENLQGGTRGTDDARDHSGLPPIPTGGPGIPALLAAAGAGYGEGFAANAHRFAPTGMLAAVKYLIEDLGFDPNAVDHEGNTATHHAAARGDNEMIEYLVSRGADVKKVNRGGQTTVDMANGPVQRIQPFPETIKLLESLGAKNNHRCVSC
jgi:ankyrin repeat protein